MSKCRNSTHKTKANKFLHIRPCWLLLAQLFNVAGHKKVTKNWKDNWYAFDSSLWRRDLSTPILWNKNSNLLKVSTYLHTYIHTDRQTDRQTDIHTYIHTYIYTYIRTYVRTYIRTYVHTYVHRYIRTYILAYIHAYRHTDTHLSIYIYTYIYIIYIYTQTTNMRFLFCGEAQRRYIRALYNIEAQNVVVECVCFWSSKQTS